MALLSISSYGWYTFSSSTLMGTEDNEHISSAATRSSVMRDTSRPQHQHVAHDHQLLQVRQ